MGAFLANAHRALHMPTRATSYRYAICADGKASLHWRHHELYNSTVAENAAKPADLSDSCRFANRNGLAVVLVGGDASCVLEFDFCIHNVVTNAPVSLAELAGASTHFLFGTTHFFFCFPLAPQVASPPTRSRPLPLNLLISLVVDQSALHVSSTFLLSHHGHSLFCRLARHCLHSQRPAFAR